MCVYVVFLIKKVQGSGWGNVCGGGDGLALIKQQKADLEGSIRFGVFDQQ